MAVLYVEPATRHKTLRCVNTKVLNAEARNLSWCAFTSTFHWKWLFDRGSARPMCTFRGLYLQGVMWAIWCCFDSIFLPLNPVCIHSNAHLKSGVSKVWPAGSCQKTNCQSFLVFKYEIQSNLGKKVFRCFSVLSEEMKIIQLQEQFY